MTKRMLKNSNWLKALLCCSKSEKEQLIKVAKPETINSICDCIKNILNGNIPLSESENNKLKAKKNVLRKLANRKTKSQERKKILIQQGGGLLTSILVPALATLVGGIFAK